MLSGNLTLAARRKTSTHCSLKCATAAAQQAGRFDDEIVPIDTTRLIKDRETGEISYQEATLSKDEGNRPQTTLDGLASLNPVIEGGSVTAGNASQLSDGRIGLRIDGSKPSSETRARRHGYLSGYGGCGATSRKKWA